MANLIRIRLMLLNGLISLKDAVVVPVRLVELPINSPTDQSISAVHTGISFFFQRETLIKAGIDDQSDSMGPILERCPPTRNPILRTRVEISFLGIWSVGSATPVFVPLFRTSQQTRRLYVFYDAWDRPEPVGFYGAGSARH